MGTLILREQDYREKMKNVVEPYLAERETVLWLEREEGRKIYCARYLAENPRGVVMISHGFKENVEKYKEIIYYFVKAHYNVYMPEHCGHGRSYRMVDDLSLVYVDSYKRYVEDFLFVSRMARSEQFGLPMYLFGHSMGGGIAAAAASMAPYLYKKVVLSSPMIRPSTGKIPWHDARMVSKAFCKAGYGKKYMTGYRPYSGPGNFEKSSSSTRARFDYYQEKQSEEPLFQTTAPSYGWFLAAAGLNHYLIREGYEKIKVPVLLFQAESDARVSNKEQDKFILKMNLVGNTQAKLVRVPGTKHEIFSIRGSKMKGYWRMVFRFFR